MTLTQHTMFSAASAGDTNAIMGFLQSGHKVNEKDRNGLTMVHYAAMNNQLETLKFLKNNAANLSALTSEGSNAIHIAAEKGHDSVIAFLKDNVSVDAANRRGDTPLHLAARHGYSKVIPLVATWHRRYAIYTSDKKKLSPLGEAITNQHVDCVEALLNELRFERIPEDKRTLHTKLALNVKNKEIIHLLLKNKFFIESEFSTECFIAAKRGTVEQVLTLFSYKENYPDAQDMLSTAAEWGRKGIVLALLKQGANVNYQKYSGTALNLAVRNGHSEVVKLLLEWNASPDNITLLAAARSIRDNHIFESILKGVQRQEYDVRSKVDFTYLLFEAVKESNVEVVKFLLERDADPSYMSVRGSAYDVAKNDEIKEILKYHMRDMKQVANFIYQKPVSVELINLLSGVHDLSEWKAKLLKQPHRGLVLQELIENQSIHINEEALELIAKKGKEDVIAYIKNSPIDQKKLLIEQALTPGTPLNKFFYVQRGLLKPSLTRGCLKELARLNNELKSNSTVPQSNWCGFFSSTTEDNQGTKGSEHVFSVAR